MKKVKPADLPPEDPYIPSTEERLEYFAQSLHAHKEGLKWKSQIERILNDFENFLTQKPAPPKAWQERYTEQGRGFDYWQVVLPGEYTDPYIDDLENIQLLQRKFGSQAFMALESELVTRNHFIYGNGHANPIQIPEPLIMLESNPQSKEVDWDCCLTVYPDGSWTAYNLDRDDDEALGENLLEVLDRWMPIFSKMRMVVPQEGRDFGAIGLYSESKD